MKDVNVIAYVEGPLTHFILPADNPSGLDRILDGACRAVDALDTEPELSPSMRSAIERLRAGLDQYRTERNAE